MRRNAHGKSNAGKVITGLILGGIVGATVGWLTAPVPGKEMRRRLTGDIAGAREKAKSAVGNVESKARELIQEPTLKEPLP